jgi:predicted SAM-dependent methyltransferase
MIHQKIKESYYVLAYPASKLLRPLYKLHYRTFRTDDLKVQIGSGLHYLEGFINIDANFQRKVDYLLDVRVGLPFPENSLDFIFSSHMLEHLHIDEAISLLRECRRVLMPGGYMRLMLPDFEFALRIVNGQESSEYPRRFGSRLGQAINFLFCDGQHKYAYTTEVMYELGAQTGFSSVVVAPSEDANIINLDAIDPGGSFSVNLFK